jgi:nitric oxide reductase NorE protein
MILHQTKTVAKPTTTQVSIPGKHIPGEPGVFIFALIDMTVFALMFAFYVYYQSLAQDTFAASQTTLSLGFGTINTLVLIISSWLLVLGIKAMKQAAYIKSQILVSGTIICGLIFIGSKVVEYRYELGLGNTMLSNDFFMFYYILTGLHLLHAIIGLGLLLYILHLTSVRHKHTLFATESVGTYWHMVDLLWIAIFALLYIA